MVDTRAEEENKYQYYGDENVENSQIESGRVPQMNSKDDIRKVKPIGFQNVDQSPFGMAE